MPSPSLPSESIARAAGLIRDADALIIAAGAGMGVDSGLPDLRGKDGFWKAYPALAEAGIEFKRIASPMAFARDPALAWGFYGHRLALYREVVPHAGFAILKRWGESKRSGTSVFTSNVDGHFQAAGFAGDDIHECHGSIHHLQCSEPCMRGIWSGRDFAPDVDTARYRLLNPPPKCPACGALARPNILMFNDFAWVEDRSEAQARRQQSWLRGISRPVVVELGAGTAIPSVRLFSEHVVSAYGGRLVRINPREYSVRGTKDVGIACGALTALMAIDEVLTAG